MKRTKEWWAQLTGVQRAELVWLERANYDIGRAKVYCPACGAFGAIDGGRCTNCEKERNTIIAKADRKVQK
jgi:hypothetical protein